MKAQDAASTFFAFVAPIFLFQFTDRVLFEGELEFQLEEGATTTGLEYANISVLPTDNLTITAGKFLLPFGVFMQRLHPTWINRFTSNPPIYGHEAEIQGIQPLLPIAADIGVMANAVVPLGGVARDLTLSAFVSNGPAPEAQMVGGGMGGAIPALTFGESAEDNNRNKMVGGRLGVVVAPEFEVDFSAMRADWGEAQVAPNAGRALGFWAINGAIEFRRGWFQLRTEWLRSGVEAEIVDTLAMTSAMTTVKRWGGYVQGALRVGAWEPVLRFGLVDANEAASDDRLTQYGFGLNYYLTPSISVMGALELNRDRFDMGADLPNDRFLVHWAFGF